ncbi:MAG: phage baseplate protein [Planctomycetota bacterium]
MQSPSAIELLSAWERGADQSNARQGIELLSLACPDRDPLELAELPIGRRDAHLLQLRERLFGESVTALANCEHCSTCIELSFKVSEVLCDSTEAGEATHAIDFQARTIRFRLPNSRDLSALAGCNDAAVAHRRLLKNCLLADGDNSQIIELLPESVIQKVVAKMAAADPQANLSFGVTCAACGHRWQCAFDIVTFLYQEINAWARRILHEVHLLASAYHWSERDILSMSPWRRHYYLQAVGR